MKKIIIIIILLVVGLGFYLINQKEVNDELDVEVTTDTIVEEEVLEFNEDLEPIVVEWARTETIGTSVEGKDIVAYQYGKGSKEIIFVGGIHGGYSWNTAAVAYDIMDYIEENESVISDDIQVTIVPVLNPDGLSDVAPNYESGIDASDIVATESEKVASRFNANNVDINRNFDCDWQESAKWQDKDVSGGDSVFSEPEARAIGDYIMINRPESVIAWYSAAGGVYSSSCNNGVLPVTSEITDLFAKASGYQAYDKFDYYATTGDFVNWLAKEGVPAVSVLLTTHDNPETAKNINGFKALLNYYK